MLNDWLFTTRAAYRMKRYELAERLGVAPQTVYRYEAGITPISPERLARIVAIFNEVAEERRGAPVTHAVQPGASALK